MAVALCVVSGHPFRVRLVGYRHLPFRFQMQELIMKRESLQFIQAVLPKGRTVFYDFVDRYALLLLEQELRAGRRAIADLKRGALAPLLQKPCIRNIMSSVGRNWLESGDLILGWPTSYDGYRLTLGSWPDLHEKPSRRWSQVTRWGWSLVLQLNLPESHKRELAESVPEWSDFVRWSPHPIAGNGELTLAWARIDIDFDTSEALVEEIQSDWVRDARYYAQPRRYGPAGDWRAYYESVLQPRAKKWPETMLTATLWFLFEELGIETVFYHTHETGAELKGIDDPQPPRSLYTDLPRKFCFRTTHNGPRFIRDAANRELRRRFTDPETKWFIHDFTSRKR